MIDGRGHYAHNWLTHVRRSLQALAGLQTAEGQHDFRRELQRLQQQLEVEQDHKQNMQVCCAQDTAYLEAHETSEV